MKVDKLLIVVAVILLICSCENLNEPGSSKYSYSVDFYMDTVNKTQKIHLYRTLALSENYDLYHLENYFIENAQLELACDGMDYNDFGLFEDPDSTHVYNYYDHYQWLYYKNNSELKILPGKEYILTIKTDDQLINGLTKVPGDFDLLIPARDTMKAEEIDGLEISWTASQDAYIYTHGKFLARQRHYSSGYTYFPDTFPLGGAYTNENHAVIDFNSSTILFVSEVDSVLIFVTAFDKNAYNHSFNGHESAGVTNAYGVFGSSVTKTAVIVIDKD